MKILHLIEQYLPPSQIWLYHLLRQSQAYEHHIATLEFRPHNFYHADFHYSQSRLSSYRGYASTLYRNKPLDILRRLALLPAEWIIGNEIEQWRNYVKEHDIALIHAHFASSACRFAALATQTKLPYIVSFYGYDYEYLPRQMPRYIQAYKALFKQADYFLCEGPFGAEALKKKGCPESKIIIQPLATEYQNIPFLERDKPVGSLRLVQVADFTEKKGQMLTVEAFARALPRCPHLSLVLVGSPRTAGYYQEVTHRIETLGISERVKIYPFIAFEELSSFLAHFDAFIHPSCHAKSGDCEGGAPMVLLDAQAMGLPIITTTHCDIPSLVRAEQTALLCAEGEPDEIALAIQRFYYMPTEEFAGMSRQARAWVEKRGQRSGIDYAKFI